ncbi:MAG: Crp/Fnr family transcriptional regulator [Spirochaetes bacterium]|nr:Crp/Fnr family transcriptional regulator [Spirochaetota bacterium]
MVDDAARTMALDVFPFLKTIGAAESKKFFAQAMYRKLTRGTTLLDSGDRCSNLPFILEGCIRIYKISENGREITLYRIEKGDSCILSTTCLFNEERFPATAVAEEDVEALFVPTQLVHELFETSSIWRTFVLGLYAHRLSLVIELVEEVVFQRLDVRIAQYLLSPRTPGKTIAITHEKIAFDLGSAREVVTRILRDFEKRGLISQERGSITIVDAEELRRQGMSAH